jgi:hypothetical protein
MARQQKRQQKPRTHNEWFRSVSLGNRKSCPSCKAKLEAGESIWTWGQYLYGKWHNITHFCKNCVLECVVTPLCNHVADCGCKVEFIGKGEALPRWLTFQELHCNLASGSKKDEDAA